MMVRLHIFTNDPNVLVTGATFRLISASSRHSLSLPTHTLSNTHLWGYFLFTNWDQWPYHLETYQTCVAITSSPSIILCTVQYVHSRVANSAVQLRHVMQITMSYYCCAYELLHTWLNEIYWCNQAIQLCICSGGFRGGSAVSMEPPAL